MGGSWEAHGRLVESSWEAHGRFMEGSWEAHGRLMEAHGRLITCRRRPRGMTWMWVIHCQDRMWSGDPAEGWRLCGTCHTWGGAERRAREVQEMAPHCLKFKIVWRNIDLNSL